MQAVCSAGLCNTFLEHHDHAFLLIEEDCFGHVYIFHLFDMMASPAQLRLKQDGLYAGQAGSLEDFFVRQVLLPFDAKDGAQPALVISLQ